MKKILHKAIILVIGICFFIVLITGCEEQELSDKKARLIATENIELKEQIKQLDKEIEKQKNLVKQCEGDKEVLKGQLDGGMQDMMSGVLESIVQENKSLQEENAKLKTQIEQLKK